MINFRPPAHLINVHVPVELVAVLADPVQVLEDGDHGLPDTAGVPGVLRGQPVSLGLEHGGSLEKKKNLGTFILIQSH